ncbi:MAG: hypothetical protein G01um101425_66 [Candidatus Peregrinibacteria bacterium Gr01-1014_25]|nr:MAG: hypothetical protein G01um101425_66 [Candidatus Peregrinibacteria bacterium Gr01-1014_25]
MPDVSASSHRAFFDAIAARRERDVRRHRTYYADRARWLRAILPADASLLEIGCGIGATLKELPHVRKVGIDLSPAMIDIARGRDHSSQYVVDDATALRHRGTYDAILLLDAINYLADVQHALGGMRGLCHERTRVVITFYNFLWQPLFLVGEWLGWKTRFPEQNWLRRSDIANLLTLAGFDVVTGGGRVLCPIGIPLFEPLCNRVFASFPVFRSLCLSQYIIARPRPRQRHDYTVTILSAVRNERGNIAPIVEAMPQIGTRTELLFAEGHSTDGTWEEIERVSREHRGPVTVRSIKQPGRGKGDALHAAIAASTGELLIVYDGDFTVHPSELTKLYDAIADGHAEFVNGSRLVYPMREGAMRMLNLIGNKLFSALFSWLFGQSLADTLSPVKAFLRRDYAGMTTRMDPFGDFDLFLGAAKQQLTMREVPVHYLERTYGMTKLSPFGHGWLLLKMWWRGTKELRWL